MWNTKQKSNKTNKNRLTDTDNRMLVTTERERSREMVNLGKGGQMHGKRRKLYFGGEHAIKYTDIKL